MAGNRITSGPRVSVGHRISTGPRTATRRAERLDVTLEQLRATGEPLAIPDADSVVDAMQGISSADKSEALLLDQIIECVIPRVTEPSIFRAGRPLTLLEHLRDELLPVLEENSELRELAIKVIDDEISRQRDILERLQTSIVA